MKSPPLKLFVVRKYIWARNAKQAIRFDKNASVDDVWVDDEFKRNANNPKEAIGFNLE